jgi:hypothetical protein
MITNHQTKELQQNQTRMPSPAIEHRPPLDATTGVLTIVIPYTTFSQERLRSLFGRSGLAGETAVLYPEIGSKVFAHQKEMVANARRETRTRISKGRAPGAAARLR